MTGHGWRRERGAARWTCVSNERLRAENAKLRDALAITNTHEQNTACDAQYYEREVERLSTEVSPLRAENKEYANSADDWRKKAAEAQRELDWLRRRRQ